MDDAGPEATSRSLELGVGDSELAAARRAHPPPQLPEQLSNVADFCLAPKYASPQEGGGGKKPQQPQQPPRDGGASSTTSSPQAAGKASAAKEWANSGGEPPVDV